jgi:hypothetical protein
VPGEIVERTLRRCQDLDIEALEEPARPELGIRQLFADTVEVKIRRLRPERHGHGKQRLERMVEPEPGRCGAKQVIMLGETPPYLAAVGFASFARKPGDAEIVEAHALAHQHAQHVMVRHDKQFGGIGEGFVAREPARIGMAVRADDRQVADKPIEPARQRAGARLDRKQTVFVQQRTQNATPSSVRAQQALRGADLSTRRRHAAQKAASKPGVRTACRPEQPCQARRDGRQSLAHPHLPSRRLRTS